MIARDLRSIRPMVVRFNNTLAYSFPVRQESFTSLQ
jgi:hypothetical protein